MAGFEPVIRTRAYATNGAEIIEFDWLRVRGNLFKIRLVRGEDGQTGGTGGVDDDDRAGGFGGEFASLGFGLDDFGGGTAAGHEKAAPVILKLAGGHAEVGLEEGVLRVASPGHDDDDACAAERDLFAEEHGLDAVGVESLARKAGVADERGRSLESRAAVEQAGGEQQEMQKFCLHEEFAVGVQNE